MNLKLTKNLYVAALMLSTILSATVSQAQPMVPGEDAASAGFPSSPVKPTLEVPTAPTAELPVPPAPPTAPTAELPVPPAPPTAPTAELPVPPVPPTAPTAELPVPPTTPTAAVAVPPQATLASSVKCIESDKTFVTVAEQGENKAVLFTWKTTEFGPEYTPKVRCMAVSKKFDDLVQSNGGSFDNLYLTAGVVKGFPVICTKKPTDTSCKTLFTLKKENRGRIEDILSRLKDAGSLGEGGIEESGGASSVIDLGAWSKRTLRAAKKNSVAITASPAAATVKPPARKIGGFKFK